MLSPYINTLTQQNLLKSGERLDALSVTWAGWPTADRLMPSTELPELRLIRVQFAVERWVLK